MKNNIQTDNYSNYIKVYDYNNMLRQQLRMNDREMDIEEVNNGGSGSQDLTPIFQREPILDKSRPSYKGSRRKQMKEEKVQVGQLFKELIFTVNTHMMVKNIDNSEVAKINNTKVPVPSKKKLKILKPQKEAKDAEVRDEPIPQIPVSKNNKKPSVKPDTKQLQKQQQAKAKSQIFKNYSKIMTYKIHPEEKLYPQYQPIQAERPRRQFTIQRNLHIVFDPATKEAKINQ